MSNLQIGSIEGVRVNLDNLVYEYNQHGVEAGTEHAFIYFLTVCNLSTQKISLLGRKWILHKETGEIEIVEGDKIVGKTPTLAPGEQFSYNSYHSVNCNSRVSGAFYGVNAENEPFYVTLPQFEMRIPKE